MSRGALLLPLLTTLLVAPACRLSDPIYAFKEIRAAEPKADGNSLVYGTIVADVGGAGDLSIVNFVRTGPAGEESNFGVNRVNLFRVFFRRAMKDGNFIIELGPGLYELDSFTTSGWGQPVTWTAKTEARRGTRFLITRPGVYDIGTIQVTPGEAQGYNVVHSMERIPRQPGQQQVLARAIEGTKWAHIAAGAANKLPAATDESQR